MNCVWNGTAAQLTTLQTTINAVRLNWDNEPAMRVVAKVSMLVEDRPEDNPGSDAAICPMTVYSTHIKATP